MTLSNIGIPGLIIILVIALILFGGNGKISKIMGDVGKGIRSFKKGLNNKDEEREGEVGDTAAVSDNSAQPTVNTTTTTSTAATGPSATKTPEATGANSG